MLPKSLTFFQILPMVSVLALAGAALAETDAEREARCEAQAGIVAMAVDLRGDNKREKKAIKLISKDEVIASGPYVAQVDVLVNWVYSLPEAQVSEEAVTAFEAACTSFKG